MKFQEKTTLLETAKTKTKVHSIVVTIDNIHSSRKSYFCLRTKKSSSHHCHNNSKKNNTRDDDRGLIFTTSSYSKMIMEKKNNNAAAKKTTNRRIRINVDDNTDATLLPPHVTNVVECIRYEIQFMEGEVSKRIVAEQQGGHDNNNNNSLDGCDDCNDGNEDEDTGNNRNSNSNNSPSSSSSSLSDLEDALDDGFLCVDLAVLERKLQIWHRLFTYKDLTVTPYYAIKCNPDPQVVHWLARTANKYGLALGYDCASVAELEHAKEQLPLLLQSKSKSSNSSSNHQMVSNTRIVYANPQRAEAALMKSLELFATEVVVPQTTGLPQLSSSSSTASSSIQQDLWLTLDGVEEVYKIHKALVDFDDKYRGTFLPPKIQLIIRIWVPDGHSLIPLGEKFGCSLDLVTTLVEACHEVDLAKHIIGISFHCGSGCEDVDTYHEALGMAQRALQKIDDLIVSLQPSSDGDGGSADSNRRRHPCWLLDMGGGYPGWDGMGGDERRFSGSSSSESGTGTKNNNNNNPTEQESEPPAAKTVVAAIAKAIRPTLEKVAQQQQPSPPNNNHESTISTHSTNDSTITASTQYHNPMTLIAEPGRYFVEACAALASRIYQKHRVPYNPSDNVVVGDDHHDCADGGADEIGYRNVYRIAHGVEGVFKDVLLCGESFIPQPLQLNGGSDRDDLTTTRTSSTNNSIILHPSIVVGPSGEVDDVVCQHCMLPDNLQVGDWLVFDRMGAYTMSIASRTGRPVVRYVLGGGGAGTGSIDSD